MNPWQRLKLALAERERLASQLRLRTICGHRSKHTATTISGLLSAVNAEIDRTLEELTE